MSTYISAQFRRAIRAAADERCAYCLSQEELLGVTFEIDHIVPSAAGGGTELSNLCLSCPSCNRHKAARVVTSDPASGESVSLFHPNQQAWSEHFAWDEDSLRVVGLTPTGRATIDALRMNRVGIVNVRRYWVVLGLHPPKP